MKLRAADDIITTQQRAQSEVKSMTYIIFEI